MRGGTLLDDCSDPSLRVVIGTLLRHGERADFAVGHVRLGAIDLTAAELQHVGRCRLLLDRLDVDMLSDAADIIAEGGPLAVNLAQLYRFAVSGRIELRSAGALRWTPDFSIIHGLPASCAAPSGSICLVGAHYFSQPVVRDGASFTCALTSQLAIRTAETRFEQLWQCGHDVLPVVHDLLARIVAYAPVEEPAPVDEHTSVVPS